MKPQIYARRWPHHESESRQPRLDDHAQAFQELKEEVRQLEAAVKLYCYVIDRLTGKR
jgi:hypothetical protein